MTADQTTVLVLYSAGLLACGAGIGYCLGWFGGRRKTVGTSRRGARRDTRPWSVSHEATGLNVVRMTLDGEGHVHTGHPLYDQEHER